MRWLVTAMVLLLLATPVLAANKEAVENKDAAVGYDSQPVVPVWHPTRDVLWDNGPFITHPGGGAGGADASALQTALGMNTYGFGHQFYLTYLVADDFTVGEGDQWCIDSITFFAYQSGSSTISPILGVYFQIWDGMPGTGTLVYGDLTTNHMTSTAWTNVYRTLDTDLMASNRPIFADVCVIGEHLVLGPGNYWIAWMTDGSTSYSGPWANPVTILGQTTTGNALQSLDAGATWAQLLDTGTYTQQGLPFVIQGSHGPSAAQAQTWSALKALYR